jgi:coenzyme PQQ precursor peptide PqqA
MTECRYCRASGRAGSGLRTSHEIHERNLPVIRWTAARRWPHDHAGALAGFDLNPWELPMAWTKPEFADIRFGFEITMYVSTR